MGEHIDNVCRLHRMCFRNQHRAMESINNRTCIRITKLLTSDGGAQRFGPLMG